MKKSVSLLLVLALCLGLGTVALADGEDGGAVVPRLDVYLDGCQDYEEGVSDPSVYGVEDLEFDPFSWASATVALEDIDKALGYMTLLEDGPFALELDACTALTLVGDSYEDVPAEHCGELRYEPNVKGFSAVFSYTGDASVSVIPGGFAPVGGGSAVGVQINVYEDTVGIDVFCAQGIRFTEEWADYTMGVGDSLRLDCPRWFGANAEQCRWAVDEGADLVDLDGQTSPSVTVTALAPGRAVVSAVCGEADDSATYSFIIEITG